jgi:hypothetical protein
LISGMIISNFFFLNYSSNFWISSSVRSLL